MASTRRRFLFQRYALYLFAARAIEKGWQRYLDNQRKEFERQQKAASVIQRAWRSFTNRKIFTFYRDLLDFRRSGTPYDLLKVVNPQEASLLDPACKSFVRFRLGGAVFPPTVYYKIFTAAAVCDVGSFAPKDYAGIRTLDPIFLNSRSSGPADRQQKREKGHIRVGKSLFSASFSDTSSIENWYKRVEGNGWRPVSVKTVNQANADAFSRKTGAVPVRAHYSPLKSREKLLQERRAKQMMRMKQLYSGKTREGAQASETPFGEEEAMDEDQEVLQWMETLDLQKDLENWNDIGTSATMGPPFLS